jgi:hypothetical protein
VGASLLDTARSFIGLTGLAHRTGDFSSASIGRVVLVSARWGRKKAALVDDLSCVLQVFLAERPAIRLLVSCRNLVHPSRMEDLRQVEDASKIILNLHEYIHQLQIISAAAIMIST